MYSIRKLKRKISISIIQITGGTKKTQQFSKRKEKEFCKQFYASLIIFSKQTKKSKKKKGKNEAADEA
jgi:hypothetical protein